MIYKETNRFGVKLTINYVESIEKVISLETLNRFFQDIYENTYRYMGNIMDGLELNIWDDLCPDLPKNVVKCENNVCSIVSYGVGNYSGLTWGSARTDLNDNLFGGAESGRNDFMANLLAHELGHVATNKVFRDEVPSDKRLSTSFFRKEFTKLTSKLGADGKEIIIPSERTAEDFRELFGPRGAKGVKRGAHVSAQDIKGLLGFYKIWKKGQDLMDFYLKDCNLEQFSFGNDNKDKDYYRVQWYCNYMNPFWKFNNRWVKVDPEGVWQNNSKNYWELVSRF